MKPVYYILIIIGVLVLIYAYNKGLFNSKTGFTSDKFPSNPKVGDTFFTHVGLKYTYVCTESNTGGTPNPQGYKCLKYGWLTDNQIQENANQPQPGRTINNSERATSNTISMCSQMKANLDAMLKKANAFQANAQTAHNHVHTFITTLPYAAFGAQESIVRCNHNKQCEQAVYNYNNKIAAWQNYMNLYRKEESAYMTQCLGEGSRNQVQSNGRVRTEGVYNANGTLANSNANLKQKTCADLCADSGGIGWSLQQYPKSSPNYPYYMCFCRHA